MKKIAILTMSVMLAFTSCDILNNDPDDSFTKSNYFTSVENVELFANYFYSAFSGYSGDFYFNILNDDQAKTGVEQWTFMQQPATASAWNSPYSNIRRCNLLVEAIPGIESMTSVQKKHWMGVARLMRAWYHYKVVRGFGDCYWVNHVLDPKADADILYGPRTDRDIVMDSVLADLNFAVENMTLNSTSRTQLNQNVANAMKAEICLYEGTFCRYRVEADGQKAPNEDRAKQYLRECCNACEAIMGSTNAYSLTPKYANVYTSLNLEGNPEMILYKHYNYPTLGHSVIDYTCGSTIVNGMTKDAFNAYLSDEGDLMTYEDDHGTLVNGKPNIGAQIAKRDPRLAAHVDAALQFPGNGVARYADDPTTEAGKNASESTSSTGYGVLKFDTKALDRVRRQSIGQGDTDAPIFWLAVIYLNYAEAKAELGEFDGTVQDLTLNKLRARAGNIWGFSVVSDPRKNMNVSDLIYEIRRERRIELMYDINDRYYALQRWHCLYLLDTQKYPDQKKGAWIGTSADADKLFDVDAAIAAGASHPDIDADGYIDCSSGNNRIYNNKYYLFPIPSDQQTLNPEIGQNYGW